MSSNDAQPRRSLDGPARRRPNVQPIAPDSGPPTPAPVPISTAVPAVATSVGAIEAIEEPVYEYQKPRRWRPRWSKKLLFIPLVLLLLVGGWFGYTAFTAVHNIIGKAGNGAPALNGTISLATLKGEGAGRVNILVMGIGGAGHEGPNLSDTMMVWSLDPKTKNVAALSIPRDLYVKLNSTSYGKINSANSYGGSAMAEKVVENVIGVPIHYYATVDFSGFKQAVDAVGGIDIDVPTALFDKQYPCDTGNGVCPYYQAAGHVHMTGTQALRYTRCRHNDAGVGNCGNDYGRSARQQSVLAALRSKAMSAGTLTNPVKITNLINAIGNHVKTDLQLGDIKKLAQIATQVDTSKITNKVLDDEPDNYLSGGTNIIPAAGYIYVPKAGLARGNYFDYSDIQDFVKNIFIDHYITDENARIEVQNGSGITGVASRVVASLKAAHYNVGDPTNATGLYSKTVIYDYTNGKKPYTINYLEQRFGVTAQKATLPSPSPTVSPAATATPTPTPEIRIILGSDYKGSSSSSSN